jgi:hypothetical protein
VNESGDGNVEVVVDQGLELEDDLELMEVLELVVVEPVEQDSSVVPCSCPQKPACQIRQYVSSVASSPLD